MSQRCGYNGCRHLVGAEGACGDRLCPRNAERGAPSGPPAPTPGPPPSSCASPARQPPQSKTPARRSNTSTGPPPTSTTSWWPARCCDPRLSALAGSSTARSTPGSATSPKRPPRLLGGRSTSATRSPGWWGTGRPASGPVTPAQYPVLSYLRWRPARLLPTSAAAWSRRYSLRYGMAKSIWP